MKPEPQVIVPVSISSGVVITDTLAVHVVRHPQQLSPALLVESHVQPAARRDVSVAELDEAIRQQVPMVPDAELPEFQEDLAWSLWKLGELATGRSFFLTSHRSVDGESDSLKVVRSRSDRSRRGSSGDGTQSSGWRREPRWSEAPLVFGLASY